MVFVQQKGPKDHHNTMSCIICNNAQQFTRALLSITKKMSKQNRNVLLTATLSLPKLGGFLVFYIYTSLPCGGEKIQKFTIILRRCPAMTDNGPFLSKKASIFLRSIMVETHGWSSYDTHSYLLKSYSTSTPSFVS